MKIARMVRRRNLKGEGVEIFIELKMRLEKRFQKMFDLFNFTYPEGNGSHLG